MVARTINLPNMHRLFLPDKGYIIVDNDLERADAQVVAWDAGDEELKRAFRSGEDIHTANAMAIFKCSVEAAKIGGQNSPRQKAKIGVHATNYGVTARTLAAHLSISEAEAALFIKNWFKAHPAIEAWQEGIKELLRRGKPITNAFGYHMPNFERGDSSFTQALAWKGQSTVAIVTHKGLVTIDETLPEVQLLLEVHDSLVMQVPELGFHEHLANVRKAMLVPVPYDDPLIIQISPAISRLDWSDVFEYDKGIKIRKLIDAGTANDEILKMFGGLSPDRLEKIANDPIWCADAKVAA